MSPVAEAGTRRPAVLWLGLGAACLLLADYVRFFAAYPCDDAFIFMRIARNWVEFGQPYFNRGEVVMGHSSHFWLWLTAAAFRIFGARPQVTAGLSIVATLAAFVLLFRLLDRRWQTHPFRALFVALALMLFLVAPYAAALMETPVAIAMLVATWLALETDRPGWAGFFAGLSFLTRYEFALIAILALLAVKNRRAFVAGLLLPGVAFLSFTLGYFHTLVPHTMIAKRIVYSGGRAGLLGAIHWPLLTASGWEMVARAVLTIAVMVALIVGGQRWRSGLRWPILGVVFSATLFVVYYAQDALVFHWYWPLLLFPLTLGAVAAMGERRVSWLLPVVLLLTASGPLTLSGRMLQGYVRQNPAWSPLFAENLRVTQYRAIGEHLRTGRPETTLLTSEIGGLGWGFYPNRLIDGAALVTPSALKYHPMKVPEERNSGTWGCIPSGIVAETRPTYIVSLPLFTQALRGAMKKGAVTGYDLIESWPVIPPEAQAEYGMPGELWGNDQIRVYGQVPTQPAR